MLRKFRIITAIIFFSLTTLLFLDFTGTIHQWLGWLAKIQFLPALLAVNLIVVVALIALTFLLGRVYCSIICPLGVLQDITSWISAKKNKNRFRFSKALNWLRYGVLTIFFILLVAGFSSIAMIIAPYGTYGRIASNLFAPLYTLGNNTLAYLAEQINSYAFYNIDVWIRSVPTFIIAVASMIILIILAWRGGRTYCNTICPVGTILGAISRFSFLKPHIDKSKCNGCGLCARNCKASCINPKEHKIDYSRCVMCLDCLDRCKQGAFSYSHPKTSTKIENSKPTDSSRRGFLTIASLLAITSTGNAKKKIDGALAAIEDKQIPNRATKIVPPGASSIQQFAQHCTACQLCVSICPNGVLRPSTSLSNLMQPEMSFEHGYCRPECTKCSSVCPTGSIKPITRSEKSATQIGHAVWIKKNCVALNDKVTCDSCAHHCPTGAITLISVDENSSDSIKIPAIDVERCIGCGACENKCPARPFSAIYVEGHQMHRTI